MCSDSGVHLLSQYQRIKSWIIFYFPGVERFEGQRFVYKSCAGLGILFCYNGNQTRVNGLALAYITAIQIVINCHSLRLEKRRKEDCHRSRKGTKQNQALCLMTCIDILPKALAMIDSSRPGQVQHISMTYKDNDEK